MSGSNAKGIWVIRLAAILALLICGILFWKYASANDGAGGRGPGFDCEQVLDSRWSLWFGMPVIFPGAALYLGILMSSLLISSRRSPATQHIGRLALGATSAAALAGGIWFAWLQVARLGRICPYCMAVHVCGGIIFVAFVASERPFGASELRRKPRVLAAAIALAAAPALLVGILIVGQFRSQRTSMFDLMRGHIDLSNIDLPVLGPRGAPHALVMMSDYTCSHCRATQPVVQEIFDRYGSQVAVIELPVPLNARCNPAVTSTSMENIDACDLARLALAVWRVRPELFATMHAWLFEPEHPRTAAEARAYAAALVGGADILDKAEQDPWITATIRRDAELYQQAGGGRIPKIIFTNAIHTGEVKNREALFAAIEKELNIRPIARN